MPARPTPEKEFYLPILSAIVSLGGRAEMNDALKIVEREMQTILTDANHQAVAIRTTEERWRTNARWARNRLAIKGLLTKVTPRGIWAINEAAKLALRHGRVD